MSTLLDKVLLDAQSPAAAVSVPLDQNSEASRHQIHITTKPAGATGLITIKGIGRGAPATKNLAPALFDARLESMNMATGGKIITFYGLLRELRFEFSGFDPATRISAVLCSQDAELLISGNGP